MPTYSTAVKTARMEALRQTVANGTLEVLDGTTVLAVFGLDANAGSVSGDVWTLALDSNIVTASAAGVADAARIKDSGGNIEVSDLTVGTSGTDLIIDNANIASGQNITVTTPITFTHAA